MEISSPVTGAAVTGLTSPAFTLVGVNSDYRTRKYYVSQLGGTQPGVVPHNIAKPFTIEVQRPATIKYPSASVLDTVGNISTVPKNRFDVKTEKGIDVNAAGGVGVSYAGAYASIPVNGTVQDLMSIKSQLSLTVGTLVAEIDDWIADMESGTV